MKLAPHPSREMRHTKVLEHWFDVHEAWWSVADDPTWARDRQALGEVLHGAPVGAGTEAETVLASAYGRYIARAETACDDAAARNTVFPTDDPYRACYVGFPGITVIVGTQRANPAPLVTSYRVADHSKTTDAAFDAAALARARRKAGPIDREAVRHAARRSSLSARKER